jgi:hypothetical protein
MTAKEHLHQMHVHESEFRTALADHHEDKAEKCRQAGMTPDQEFHKSMAKELRRSADYHGKCAASMAEAASAEKAAQNRIAPDRVSSVATSDAPIGIKAVPRIGAPAMPSAIDKAAIPAQFSHLISSMEEND